MKIIFFGTPDFVIPVLKSLVANFTVVGIVTTPDTIQGRKKILTPTPVKVFAMKHDIPVFQPEKLKDGKSMENVKRSEIPLRGRQLTMDNLDPDLFVVAAYGKIIPQEILNVPKYGAINIHPSLLPKYRGPSPLQATILNGEAKTGVTFIKMDEKMDHGPILQTLPVSIAPDETFVTLHTRAFKIAADHLTILIKQFANGKIISQTQDESKATYCKMIKKEDGFIDLKNPPSIEKIDRMIRAYYPWPSVWTRLHQDSGGQAKKGTILKILPGKFVQLEGKKPVDLKTFLVGYPQFRPQLERLFAL